MGNETQPRIIDITKKKRYERYLYQCFVLPFQKYRKRYEYLQYAIPKGFHKRILIWDKDVVGQIEYAPASAGGLPIDGDGVFVMNCIWVLRKAKGNNLGKVLLEDVIQSIREESATGLATIALEGHSSPWLKKDQMEKLGFKAVESVEFKNIIKSKGDLFKVYLMWLPINNDTKLPTWKPKNLTEGVGFCLAHPLYHAESIKSNEIFEINKRV